jgi:hypothetical protein
LSAVTAPVLLYLVLAAAPALPGATNHTEQPRFIEASPKAVAGIVEEIAKLPDIHSRVLAASERFLGVPYQFDALGEGPGHPPDEDPRLRWDLADCQTFLETVLAVARSRTADELLSVLDDIRYDGEPAYEHRLHFFEGQWIPTNTRKGYARVVTEALGGKDTVRHTKEVTRQQWTARNLGEKILLPDERAPVGSFPLPYLPLKKIPAMAASIPSGTFFAVAREDRPRSPTMISHLGIVVQKKEGTYVRHAGRDLYAQVVDEEFAHFLARNATYTKWPVLGLVFLEPSEGRGLASAGER